MDLFDFNTSYKPPLAERMRPSTLSEFVGQQHIVSNGSLLSRAIQADKLGSCIFYGPAGCGKTSLASIVANCSDAFFEKLNAVSSGVADAKAVIDKAKENKKLYNKKTYLMLDECHRWSKAQSDCVLASIENGTIVFIGCTTENPQIALTRAIVSRCRIFEFLPLSDKDILQGLEYCLNDKERGFGELALVVDKQALQHLAFSANGDLRKAYNALELAVDTTLPSKDNTIYIDKSIAEQSIQLKALSIDDSIFYDCLSAFCKSIRGSDPSAALFWAFRLINAGCDPLIIYRRLIVHCSEDIGLADNQALVIATSSMIAYQNIGMPEGRIPLAHAIIYACQAKKSNAVIVALDKVMQDIKDYAHTQVPDYLRDRHYPSTLDSNLPYQYPPNYKDGECKQEYMPKELIGKKYYYEK